jgi:cholest-4-en-3-one 26-monooxygenase
VTAAAPTIELLAGDFYDERARAAHTWMRAHAPVHFDPKCGMWGVATYDAVRRAGGEPETCSGARGSRPESPGPMPWMIDMDPPDHLKRRKLVNRGFTPARVRAREDHIRRLCDEIIDGVCERGECDLLRDVAAPLPLIVIGDMLGVPPADRPQLLAWSDDLIASITGDPDKVAAAADAFGEYHAYARRTIAARREEPGDDLVSLLAHAEVDGEHLDDDELVMESLLLLLGGDETTRHVTVGGTEQLLLHPDQWATLVADRSGVPVAVEEMLRYVSPIKNMQRVATRDVVVEGQALHAGDRVLLLYESANFDESQFPDAARFDIARQPNEHVAFGFGTHFCLGASLARLELQVMFDRLLSRLPDLERATDDVLPRLLGNVTTLPVRFTPSAPVGPSR